ncbi:unnamed protein product [Spirodela intermedia]|uniref:Uncharacterized protein n=1 Tax=Spirodela intermedia TaxID=51605 RepID=A0A7I8JGW9_SPIIN|nr:unnamed protein product [Spirodela intermedia]CAA6669390.1 unnamed protein product [Spirodela intermedia]
MSEEEGQKTLGFLPFGTFTLAVAVRRWTVMETVQKDYRLF